MPATLTAPAHTQNPMGTIDAPVVRSSRVAESTQRNRNHTQAREYCRYDKSDRTYPLRQSVDHVTGAVFALISCIVLAVIVVALGVLN